VTLIVALSPLAALTAVYLSPSAAVIFAKTWREGFLSVFSAIFRHFHSGMALAEGA
jgi:hypothetical protein